MNATAIINGHDLDGYIISIERLERLCEPGQNWTLELAVNCPYTINPWHDITIHEDGNKVLTGYVSSNSLKWQRQPVRLVEGLDTWKRATDGWNDAEYVTASTDTIIGLICHFLDLAGLTYSIDSSFDMPVPGGLSILFEPYAQIVRKLASAINLFIRIDEDGVVHIGDIIQDGGSGTDITQGTNLINVDLLQSDYRARNRVIVFGPTSMAEVRSDEDWATVDHTMVVGSPYVPDAWQLANTLWNAFHDLEEVKTCEVLHDSSRRVGQTVDITSDIWSGSDICTTLKSRHNKGVGKSMTSIHGERCAAFGTPGIPDGRDVIVATHESGVWRCRDIWQAVPHWEPLNIGLANPEMYGEADVGSSYKCDWFIRDPYEPNQLAFLLNETGLHKTHSLEPGYENWSSVKYNVQVGPHFGDFIEACNWSIVKIRSTIAEKGVYYVVVRNDLGVTSAYPSCFFGVTSDYFIHLNGGKETPYGNYDGYAPPRPCQDGAPVNHSGMWGYGRNNLYERHTRIASWHNGGGGNLGGLAAWHRNAYGCTAVGTQAYGASNGGPEWWNAGRNADPGGIYDTRGYTDTITTLYKQLVGLWCDCTIAPFVSPNSPEWPMKQCVSDGHFDVANVTACPDYVDYYAPMNTKDCALHIPYNQTYIAGSHRPSIIYFHPGDWDGADYVNAYPAKWVAGVGLQRIDNLPWSGTCHNLQGSFGTYTPNRAKVYAFGPGKPSQFATSEDECLTWTERESVPVETSCFSGFPYSEQKVYAGRHPENDATPLDGSDKALIYVTWDRGETWTDVTGDLWDQTATLQQRSNGMGGWAGTAGLVTIAPRWCW